MNNFSAQFGRQSLKLGLFAVALFCCVEQVRSQTTGPWLTVSQGSDGERQIFTGSLQAVGTTVLYTARHRSGQAEYRMQVQIDCVKGQRRDHIPPNAPENWFALSRLLPSMVEESLFACRWLQGDVSAREKVRLANSDAREMAPSTIPAERTPVAPRRSSGSGFLVSARQVITNHHVIQDCKSVTVRQGDQTRGGEIASKHAATDLALLVLDAPLGSHLAVRTSAVLGEDVMVAGHPLSSMLSSDLTVTTGQVNSLSGISNDPTLFQLSAGVHAGNSGGPVLDRTGAVVGVVVSKLDTLKLARATGEFSQNINFAIKPEVLRLFLDTNRVRYENSSRTGRLEGPQLAERARQATVQVLCTS